MLVCKKCGANNPLGRVFCAACGAKLDLANMTRDTVAESQRVNLFAAHWRKLIIVLVVLLVGTVGLAFWPHSEPIGQKGNTIGAGKVVRQMNALLSIGKGRRLTIDLTEKDINGYLEHRKIRRTDIQMCTVRIMPGSFGMRLVRKLGSFPLGPIRVEPALSYDIRCTPLGNQLVIVSASVGHLKVFGPLIYIAVNPYIELFEGDKEQELLKAVSEIELKNGVVTLTVAP